MIPANEIKAWSNVATKPPTQKQYLMNLEEKMHEKEFFKILLLYLGRMKHMIILKHMTWLKKAF